MPCTRLCRGRRWSISQPTKRCLDEEDNERTRKSHFSIPSPAGRDLASSMRNGRLPAPGRERLRGVGQGPKPQASRRGRRSAGPRPQAEDETQTRRPPVPQPEERLPARGPAAPQPEERPPVRGPAVPQPEGRPPVKRPAVPQPEERLPGQCPARLRPQGGDLDAPKGLLTLKEAFSGRRASQIAALKGRLSACERTRPASPAAGWPGAVTSACGAPSRKQRAPSGRPATSIPAASRT
jgi:hypothetical protein